MRRMNRRSPWLVALLLIAIVAGACSDSDSDSASQTTFRDASGDATNTTTAGATTTTAGATATTFAATATTAADSLPGGESSREAVSAGTISLSGTNQLGDDRIAPVVFQTLDFGRDIIFTAEMSVAVTDVAVAGDTATREIAALGGFLFGQRTTGAPNPTSVLTFKVLPKDFTEALDRLGAIGDIRSQNVSTSDVTERIVDLESRILTAEASVERLRELLSSAGGVAVVVQVESELLQRETQLETLRGQLRTLEDQVGLATIVISLTEAVTRPGIELAVTAYPGHEDLGRSCPGDFGLSIEENTEATVCFEIINVGDTTLTGLELSDPVLDITLADLTLVEGGSTGTIEPGERIIMALEIVPERDVRTQTRVSATPLNQEGQPQEDRSVANTTSVFIDTVDPGGLPGFTEGLSASLAFLADLGRIFILTAGVLLPFSWLLPIAAWLLVRWRRRQGVLIPEVDDAALESG